MTAAWWDRAPDLFESAFQETRGRTGSRRYRFGLGRFELDSDDAALNRRFSELYPEGERSRAGPEEGPRVRCAIRSLEDPSVAAIRFEDPEELDAVDFCRTLFADRNYVPGPESPGGWKTLGLAGQAPLIAMKGSQAIADRGQAWQPLVANLAVNRVLRLQRDLMFFHAAATSYRDRGAIFLGGKGAGKTTTALALAARGHGFLGDEVAAIRIRDGRMFPFRRAASIRQGARAERVTKRLEACAFPTETFPDGTPRVLANVADLLPDAPGEESTLACAFFLGSFAGHPRARRFDFGLEHFALLTPLSSSMWQVPTGLRMLQLSRLFGGVRCYHLDAGPPDETARFVETLLEELPH